MKRNKHHMLDTNIILAMVLPNDNSYKEAKEYLKTEYLRYISKNSKNEAERKIRNIRKISLNISNYIKEYSLKNNINIIKINKEKSKVKNNYLNKYENKKFPINMPQDRFKDLVSDFFINNENEINLVLINNENKELNKLIKNTFNENIINLNDFVDKYYQITFVSSGSEIENFKNLGAHKKDAILLDEAYYLHLTLNEPVNFITFDSKVLDLKDDIHNSISSEVTVSSPIEFISAKT